MAGVEVLVWEGAKVVLSAAASSGTKILVDEAVKKLTPDNLSAFKKWTVEVAKWGGSAAAGTIIAQGIAKELEKGQKVCDFILKATKMKDEAEKDAEPVIDATEDITPVEIEEPEDDEE